MQRDLEVANNIKVKWRCPSNIAIVKYWGKKGVQIPCNSSLSLTLSNAYTEVEVSLDEKTSTEDVELNYFFEGEKNESFSKRVVKYLKANRENFPYLGKYAITVHSSNSFPHSAGIASSASAFGALALAMLDITYTLEEKEIDDEFYRTASHLARLGSGSASRSIYPSFALWGENEKMEGTSNKYAVPVNDIHPVFQNMRDAILIVDDEPKKVSSTVGHSLMVDHPYAEKRFEQADQRTGELISILKNGEMDAFIKMCESEALTLHAMMMTSSDYYLLIKPGTVQVIEKLMQFREETGTPVCFTLDAGPNVHVLYPEEHAEKVEAFLKNDLVGFYKSMLLDVEGKGPQKLNDFK